MVAATETTTTKERLLSYLNPPDLTIAEKKAGMAKYFDTIHVPGEWHEERVIKALKGGLKMSAFIDNTGSAVNIAWEMNTRARQTYSLLNPCDSEMRHLALNRIVDYPERTAANKDITRRALQYIEFDAGQPEGMMATDAERKATFELAADGIDFLLANGFTLDNFIEMSTGNGYALVTAVDLSNSEEDTALVKKMYDYIAMRFGGKETEPHFDEKVFNLARLAKVPFTDVRKGDSTPDRPYRISYTTRMPDKLLPVSKETIKALADKLPEKPKVDHVTGANQHKFNFLQFARDNNIEVFKENKPWHDGLLHEFRCWSNPNHTVAWCWELPNGGYKAACHHKSCTWNEHDMRAHFDPEYKKQPKNKTERTLYYAGTKPQIMLSEGKPMHQYTDEALAALVQDNTASPYVFKYGRGLVRIKLTAEGIPVLEEVDKDACRGMLDRCAAWMKVVGKDRDLENVPPPPEIVADFMKLGTTWNGLPSILGVTQSPIIRGDGTIHNIRGYEPHTQQYYFPPRGFAMQEIPEYPTNLDVFNSLNKMYEAYYDFAWDSEASRANILAATFTPFMRAFYSTNTPMCVINKKQAGSGGTYIAQCLAIITTGNQAAVMGAPQRDEEWPKAIATVLIQGRQVNLIDNVDGTLQNDDLERLLTSKIFHTRDLGKLKGLDLPNNGMWFTTGNNTKLKGAMPRRCYLSQIDPGIANPAQRDPKIFKHANLLNWVTTERPAIIAAIYTIIRAWIQAGKPLYSKPCPLGSFEEWVSVIGGLLEFAGVKGFLENLDILMKVNNEEDGPWTAFISEWYELFQDNPMTAQDIAAEIKAQPSFASICPISPRVNKKGEVDDANFPRRLGIALASREGRVYTEDKYDYKFERDPKTKARALQYIVKKGAIGSFARARLTDFSLKSESCESVLHQTHEEKSVQIKNTNTSDNGILVDCEKDSPNSLLASKPSESCGKDSLSKGDDDGNDNDIEI